MNNRELDRWITGNYGRDNDPEEIMRQRGLSREEIARIQNGGYRMTGIVATIDGEECRFCGEMCKGGFECDRENGVVYPAMIDTDENGDRIRDGKGNYVLIEIEAASMKHGFCAYCSQSLWSDEKI